MNQLLMLAAILWAVIGVGWLATGSVHPFMAAMAAFTASAFALTQIREG